MSSFLCIPLCSSFFSSSLSFFPLLFFCPLCLDFFFFNSITPLPLTFPPSSTHFLVSSNQTCPIFISSFFCYPSAILTPLFPLGFFFFPFPLFSLFYPFHLSFLPAFILTFLHLFKITPFLIFFCLLSGGTSLPSVHLTISSSVACSQSVPQCRCWLPWIQRLWTGNRKRRSQLQTLSPTGGQGLPYWFLLRLKLRLPHGKSGKLLAQACFTSSA